MAHAGFLDVAGRSEKPRAVGLTCVIDKGLPVEATSDLLASASRYVDVWKFGWGTAYLDPGLPAKVRLLAASGTLACLGGTLLEIAWDQGRAGQCLDWAASVGLPAVEVSSGTVTMSRRDKDELIEGASRRFVVLAEVGTKDAGAVQPPEWWAAEAAADLAAGAAWVLAEGRESGTVGVYTPDGEVRTAVVDALVSAVGIDRAVFEAPRKDQQAWFVRRYGPDVNLANVPPPDVVGLEALRLGLRADTYHALRPATARPVGAVLG